MKFSLRQQTKRTVPTHPWKHVVQARKREEAEVRKAQREKRSPKEQLALLDARGVTATRERKRLEAQIA